MGESIDSGSWRRVFDIETDLEIASLAREVADFLYQNSGETFALNDGVLASETLKFARNTFAGGPQKLKVFDTEFIRRSLVWSDVTAGGFNRSHPSISNEHWDVFEMWTAEPKGTYERDPNGIDRLPGYYLDDTGLHLEDMDGSFEKEFGPDVSKGIGEQNPFEDRENVEPPPHPGSNSSSPSGEEQRRPAVDGKRGDVGGVLGGVVQIAQAGSDVFSDASGDFPSTGAPLGALNGNLREDLPEAQSEVLPEDLPDGLPEDLPRALSEQFDASGARFEAALRLDADGNLEAPVEGDAYIDVIAKHGVWLTNRDATGVFLALPLFNAEGVFADIEAIRNAKGELYEVDALEATNRRWDGPFSAAVRAVAEGASSQQPGGEAQTGNLAEVVEPTQPAKLELPDEGNAPASQARPASQPRLAGRRPPAEQRGAIEPSPPDR